VQPSDIAYIALVSKDVDKASTLFEKTLGLKRTDVEASKGRTVPVFSVGQTAIALFEPGDPCVDGHQKAGVHHIAFNTSHPDDTIAELKQVGIDVLEDRSMGLRGNPRLALAPSATAGVKVYYTAPLNLDRSSAGMVERIDHLGIASADNRAAIDIFCNKLGLPLESQQTDVETQIAVESFTSDKYGAVYHSRPPMVTGGLRVAFITAGDCELEFLQNFDPGQDGIVRHGNAGTTQQDQGAITRYIQSRGPGLHHVAFKVSDIDSVLAALNEQGFPTIDHVGRPGSRRARIGFVNPKSLGGILIHFVQR
jgi:catechol 2,3-dioxygenase-like lactoylglutathione lyase family enzyme/predicted enzyme related to lactoylglutathione lyase